MNLQALTNVFPMKYMQSVTHSIDRAVRVSFREHPMRHPGSDGYSRDEVIRRVKWCCDTAVTLRTDHHWSTERICDEMHRALDSYLRLGFWTPPAGTVWWGA